MICCHHTSVFITSTVITKQYLDAIIQHGRLDDSQFMCIKRSVKFDLTSRDGIIEASKAIIGLLRYLLSDVEMRAQPSLNTALG